MENFHEIVFEDLSYLQFLMKTLLSDIKQSYVSGVLITSATILYFKTPQANYSSSHETGK